MIWICIIYVAGMAAFLGLAERAPLETGNRFSDDTVAEPQPTIAIDALNYLAQR